MHLILISISSIFGTILIMIMMMMMNMIMMMTMTMTMTMTMMMMIMILMIITIVMIIKPVITRMIIMIFMMMMAMMIMITYNNDDTHDDDGDNTAQEWTQSFPSPSSPSPIQTYLGYYRCVRLAGCSPFILQMSNLPSTCPTSPPLTHPFIITPVRSQQL